MPFLGLGVSTSKAGAVEQPTLINNTKSVEFDGVNDLILLDNDLKAITETGTRSICAWVKAEDTTPVTDSNRGRVFSIYKSPNNTSLGISAINSGPSQWGYFYRQTGDTFVSVDTGVDVSTKWTHLAITQNGANINFYINGSLVSSKTDGTYIYTSRSNAAIGSHWTGGGNLQDFGGNIDEVGLWNSELSATEIKAIYDNVRLDLSKNSVGYASSSGLAGWWRMGDGDTYPCIADQRKTFLSGKSVEFDGVNDYFRCHDHPSIDNIWDGGGTCSMWVYLNPTATPASNGGLVHKSGIGNDGWSIYLDNYTSSKYKFRFNQKWNNEDLIQEAHVVYPYRWYHIVVTYDSSSNSNRAVFYLDAVAQTFDVISSLYDASDSTSYDSDSSNDLEIGRKTTGGIYQNFRISDLALWDVVLDSDDVTSIYNSGVPNDLTLAASYNTDRTSNLKLYYSFGDVVDTASVGSNYPNGLSDTLTSAANAAGSYFLDKSDLTYSSNVADVEFMDPNEYFVQGGNSVTLSNGNLIFENVDTDGGVSSRGIASINITSGRLTSVPTTNRYNKVTIRCKINTGSAEWGVHTQSHNGTYGTFSNTEFEDYVFLYRKDHGDANWFCPTSTTAGQIITVSSFKIEPCDGNPIQAKTIAIADLMAFAPTRNSAEMITMTSGDIEENVKG